ncbi:protein of unknown function [Paenibacillus sp. UNC496MF]|uniref:DUF4183 domain-containing protein n=1 Tax=Paenibacillus sp. UNC496MF TaxID=1502753 RepID=UPI0008DEF507|nr:DUF4183 domain-containing protein [Paenibacillus sp. UNC496MF]SFJ24039.1 protein of unknown function [Paenibacillus sp. UNC496MF]
MPTQLFNIVTPSVQASVGTFFFSSSALTDVTTFTVTGAQFANDAGDTPSTIPDVSPNGYYNLFINGVLQQRTTYVVTPGAGATGTVVFTSDAPFSLLADTPVILEAVSLTAV